FHCLKMPDALTGPRVEREDAIGKEIVAVARDAIEIERGRAGCRKYHAELRVDRDTGPRVGATGDLVCLRRPRFVSELAGFRNGMKDPAQLAGIHVERSNVTRRAGERFRNAAADNDHVFEDRARRTGADAQTFGRLIEAFSQIDPSLDAERSDGCPG